MKKLALLFLAFGVIALIISCFGGSDTPPDHQGEGEAKPEANPNLGDSHIVIDSCRMAKDMDGSPIVIVKYLFTNHGDSSASFSLAVKDSVYQKGVGLMPAYFVDESANYSFDNMSKEIKPGITLEVEAAYTLNDTATPIEVEVEPLFSLSSEKVTKTFPLPAVTP